MATERHNETETNKKSGIESSVVYRTRNSPLNVVIIEQSSVRCVAGEEAIG